MSWMAQLSNWIWSPVLLGAFLLVGLYFSMGTGFFQLFHLPVWWRSTVGTLGRRTLREKGPMSQLQAMATALAATIGTGSIAGVATAIFYGGPGAVFWMWVSALLSMMTGCAEKLLAVRYRERGPDGNWRGGPMVYMRDGLHMPRLALLFALACVGETLVGGNLAQANSIATALHASFGVDRLVVGVVLALLVSVVLAGGIRRVGQISELLVPVMGLLFVGGGLLVIAARWQAVPAALEQIVHHAFAPRAVVGGYGMGVALRFGVARGVFTNEAGLGLSAIAHACADVKEPAEQGMWGIFEVFVSTLVICTVTALVVLTSGLYQVEESLSLLNSGLVPERMLGAPLVAAGFGSVLGAAGEGLVALCLVLFAFTSVLGAGCYGCRGMESFTGVRWLPLLYRMAFPVCLVLGAVAELSQVWYLVDVFNGLLAIPNLLALLLLSPEVFRCLRRWQRQGTGSGLRHEKKSEAD